MNRRLYILYETIEYDLYMKYEKKNIHWLKKLCHRLSHTRKSQLQFTTQSYFFFLLFFKIFLFVYELNKYHDNQLTWYLFNSYTALGTVLT